MPDRFWVGGTANWDGNAGTKWSATSGGPGGASVPTAADDVFFNAASGASVVTITGTTARCRNLNCAGFTGTIAGSSFQFECYGNFVLSSAMAYTSTNPIFFYENTGTFTIDLQGKTIGAVTLNGSATRSLASAFTSSGALTVVIGTFTTNNFNVTATSLSSSNTNTRTINLGSSTVTLSAGTALTFTTGTNLTFNAGTSSIVCNNLSVTFGGSGQTFHNVSFTATTGTLHQIQGANIFNNLTFAGRASAGITPVNFTANQTINGTLTLSAGADATTRTFVRSNTIGETRTLTCAAVASLTDIDFRDITIAGAAAPVSGTRLGDCKGNSAITFPAPKTVFWSTSASAAWGVSAGSSWTLVQGTGGAVTNFPLAQDTAVFPTGFPNSGATITINAAYNIGTINMSARTSNTMTLATSTNAPTIYGNWINGTGTTLTGTGNLTFSGRGSQTITSAGKTFTQPLLIITPGGSVILQDALVSSSATSFVQRGTLDANGYNVTLPQIQNNASNEVRTIAIGSGTWTLTGTNPWSHTPTTNLTVTGTGTISLTSASAKTFTGGGIQTYPTINQGGTGTLTITGSNKFANITNTVIGQVLFTGGTTNDFDAFNLNGSSTFTRVGVSSTNATQAILRKSSAWNVGSGSFNGGNNTGLSFTGTNPNFLSISYINGVVVVAPTSQLFYGSTNITNLRFGGSPVTAVFYGSTQVF